MISILSLNLRLQVSIDGRNAFSHRKEGLLRCMAAEKTDIMGFQEVSAAMRDCVAGGLPDYAFIGKSNREWGKKEYNPIAYRKDTLELTETGTFWLSSTPDLPGSRFWLQSPNPRTCTWGEFCHKGSGIRFRYFNTHLDHLSHHARAKGLLVLFDRIADMQSREKLPIFLGGDFNFTPHSTLYALCHSYGIGQDDTRLVDLSAHLPTSFHWFGKLKRPFKLDYVFADSDTASEQFSVQVLRYNDEGGFLSDHDAVCMRWLLQPNA